MVASSRISAEEQRVVFMEINLSSITGKLGSLLVDDGGSVLSTDIRTALVQRLLFHHVNRYDGVL